MPSISEKGLSMPPSPIRKLVPYAEKAISQGKEVIHLNIGQPDIKTPDIAIERIKNLDRTVIEYSHSAGFESYRKGLARYYQNVGIDVDHSNIIVTTGGSEALLFGFMSCFDPGDEVIVPQPFYANYNGFAVASGVNIVPIASSINHAFALPHTIAFKEALTPKTKGILICNPGNPTGYLYTKEELETIRDIVVEHDLFLFADEVYREFCYDGRTHHSVMNLEGIENNVIMVDSVSKRYSMCGARVGALVTKNRDVLDAVMKFAQARLSPPTLAQIASEAALETEPEYFDEVIEEYVSRRNLLVDGLNQIEGVICPKPSGAFYAIAKLPVDSAERFCQWILEDFEHEGKTVMMAPARGFYATPGQGVDEVRIAYVLDKEKLQEAIECLRIALEKYPRTPPSIT